MSARSRRSSKLDSCRRLRSAQLEENLVRKRQAEYERLNFWNSNSTYFKTWEFNTGLHSTWADFDSSERLQKLEELKKKEAALESRRAKLRKLFEDEEKCYREELEKNKKKTPLLEDMNSINIEYLLREEEARRKERDIKMYHYWRENQPSLRTFERKQHSDYVKLSWLEQVAEKRKKREEEEKKILENLRELKQMQEEHAKMENELREEKKRTEIELKCFLEKQMELAKCKEEQQNILKSEEAETLKIQNELDDMIEKRRQLEEKRKRIDLSWFHRKQYQVLLKKRAKEVQENLECDRKFLEAITNEKKYEMEADSERVAQFRRDLEMAREVYKKQAEIEKLRISQAEYLFDEEAKRMYEKQEAEWKRESDARQKLMDDVLKSLQMQIQEKLLHNLSVQENIRKEREVILKSLEKANEELKEYQERAKQSLESWRKDLDQQILEKQLEAYYRKKKEEEDKENILRAKKAEEEKLCQELKKMYLEGYQPKGHGRKNFTWQ